jgi:hypothetical protein
MRKRLAIILALVVVGLVGIPWVAEWLCGFVPASCSYCVEARFETLPPDDKALSRWLQAQPYVVAHTVWVTRSDRDPGLGSVGFFLSGPLRKHRPLPDLDGQCSELGYKGADGPFRDCKDRSPEGHHLSPWDAAQP